MNRAYVLIAEDEPLASMALRAQVEALGHRVAAVARDGDEALALGRCLPVDLAVFDMSMPGRSGIDAAQRVFEFAPTPVLLVTGFGTSDLPAPMPQPPIFAVLTKPIGLDDLRDGIRAARDAFDAWARREDRNLEVRRSHEDRTIIARALESARDGTTTAVAALDLVRRADESGRTPLDLARDILDESG